MSHFHVLVALPGSIKREGLDDALTAALAPFDENKEVQWVPPSTDEDGWKDGGHWTNPQAKWDWWVVGGRWRGHFLPKDELAAALDADDRLYVAEAYRSPFSSDGDMVTEIGRCDGGRVEALDLEGLRAEKAEKAGRDWDAYHAAVEGTAPARPWSEFVERVERAEAEAPKSWDSICSELWAAGLAVADVPNKAEVYKLQESKDSDDQRRWKLYKEATSQEVFNSARALHYASISYDIDRARADYGAQERVQFLRSHPEYRNWLFTSPIEHFEPYDRETFMERERVGAVKGYALLTKDGQWAAKGEMGWFGMDSSSPDQEEYYITTVNRYLDTLLPGDWLISVDAHI